MRRHGDGGFIVEQRSRSIRRADARQICRSAAPGNINKLVRWKDTVEQLGLAGVTFHDLRHSGNTLAARCGVSTRDLMARMGHDSPPAAILYQHATTEADARIAAALDAELTADDAELTADDGRADEDDQAGGSPDA